MNKFQRKYWHDRGVIDDILDTLGITYKEDREWKWYEFPIGDVHNKPLFIKLYKAPGAPDDQPRFMYKPKGSQASLYPLVYLSKGIKKIYLCEGESDVLALLSIGKEAITSTSGAKTFPSEWLLYFPADIEVVCCYDNDEAGNEGRKIIEEVFSTRKDITLKHIHIPKDCPGKDITDYLLWKGNIDELKEEIIHSPKEPGKGRIPLSIGKPFKQYPYKEWKNEIIKNFPELWNATEICASVVVQLLIKDVHNPFCLVLLDSPASGKTITLNFFREIEKLIEYCDDFTPASFVTGIAGRSEEQLKKIDLLPRIRYRVLTVPEMACVMSENEDDLRKRLGVMTRVLDGEGFISNTGVHGARGYKGDYLFMMLGASTPFPLRVWKAMTGFGHRMFFLNLGTSDPEIDQLVNQLDGNGYKFGESRCQNATEAFIKTLWAKYPKGVKWEHKKDNIKAKESIAHLAQFQSAFRGDIIVYERRDEDGYSISHNKPEIEKPHRANQCLYNLARGHALLHGRTYITEDDIETLVRVVLSTAPSPRPDLLRLLLRSKGKVTAKEIEEKLNVVRNTAKKEMTKLEVLKICTIEGKRKAEDDDEPWMDNTKWIMYLCPKFRWLLEEKYIIT